MTTSALIIDDELQIRRLLRVTLEAAGYVVFEAESGQAGLAEVAFRRPDVILLDLGLPDMDGLEVLARLREWSGTPVVILSVRDRDDDKVTALDAGADDYVTKPFSTAELLARLRVAQRRAQPAATDSTLVFGRLVIDLATRNVTLDGAPLKLTATEYALLRLLARNAGRVLTHRQILREIWGPQAGEHRQYLRVYITHLRRKIEGDPGSPYLIQTEAGIGYRMQAAD